MLVQSRRLKTTQRASILSVLFDRGTKTSSDDLSATEYVYMQPNMTKNMCRKTKKKPTKEETRKRRREEKEPWKWKAILPSFPRFGTNVHVLVRHSCVLCVMLFIHLIYEYYDHTRISSVSFCFSVPFFEHFFYFYFFSFVRSFVFCFFCFSLACWLVQFFFFSVFDSLLFTCGYT